jgi:eukaryotic-like serine/threonine-protein kinase
MTLCENGSLERFIEGNALSLDRRVELFLQLAFAVSYMHEQGILHRDLKLSNAMVDASGNSLLIDLDLCCDSTTNNNAPVGTLRYMAPELSLGKTGCSQSTDQYALGVMLFELLDWDSRPKNSPQDENSQIACTTHSLVVDKSVVRSQDWNAIVARATHGNSASRYPSVSHLAKDVELLSRGQNISTRVPTRVERLGRWIQQNPRTALLSAATASSLLIGVTSLSFSLFKAERARASSLQYHPLEREG